MSQEPRNENDRQDEQSEEQKFSALFASLRAQESEHLNQLLAVDEFRLSLETKSAEVFASSDQTDINVGDSSTISIDRQVSLASRRKRMFFLASRGLAVACVLGLVVVGAVWLAGTGSSSAGTLADSLQQINNAKTVEFTLAINDQKSTVYTQGWNKVRWQSEDDTKYRIARGGRAWEIDEAANKGQVEKSPIGNEEGAKLGVLDLLELPELPTADALAVAKPVRQIERAGVDCDVFELDVAGDDEPWRLAAYVNAAESELSEIVGLRRVDGNWKPCVTLKVEQVNPPLDEELFVVGKTLTQDGRIGKIVNAQGIVALRPKMARRFTPVSRAGMLLRSGDWVRTDVRGANAVNFRLAPEANVTLGPGTVVELASPTKIVLQNGTAKVVATEQAPIELYGPEGQRATVTAEVLYRIDKANGGKLVVVEKTPKWLAGFEGATADQSIGSLIVEVDGRNTPLHVGYHKVTVDIHDQIARTVIEQSFVNNTDSRLEGVFYFPLPQDASISGFGMWIGDELVEADVVEKQRAREIYETILREKRDPGLLEWTGGNIFKARVFPIFAHSEKRVKITYTQVLPRQGNQYRYTYALQSEMLKQHPLRELMLDVRLSSVTPLVSVSSPTLSTARTEQTKHSARVEFTAQEYSPDRDFEVVVEVDQRAPQVTLIPHRRGDDGYFMALVAPPSRDGTRRKDVLPDGDPLELVLLADTSASLSMSDRENQAAFVASLLGSLSPDDKFNLATCDVECDFVFDMPVPATAENIQAARDKLAERFSLGWSDLDGAFEKALAQCGPDSQIIYIGDGITTTGNADPIEFGNRLRRTANGRTSGFHAVSVSSSYEPMTLKAIASLGGGSMRNIDGARGPQVIAMELLSELTKPGLRDLKVEFEGIRTARVYPDALPNLPIGSQHIVLGRYLPEGQDQIGNVVVTGMQGDEPFTLTTPVSLKDAESGNSFIPRLWARMHLDALLEQGSSTQVKDDIIALSEEFHIITPYTSLLVLESDADRERFGVKRRFNMRDGERFFAEGREKANYDLLQKQMRLAGTWRLGLRQQVLRSLMGLGRTMPNVTSTRSGLTVLSEMDARRRGNLGWGFQHSAITGPYGYVGNEKQKSLEWYRIHDLTDMDENGLSHWTMETETLSGDMLFSQSEVTDGLSVGFNSLVPSPVESPISPSIPVMRDPVMRDFAPVDDIDMLLEMPELSAARESRLGPAAFQPFINRPMSANGRFRSDLGAGTVYGGSASYFRMDQFAEASFGAFDDRLPRGQSRFDLPLSRKPGWGSGDWIDQTFPYLQPPTTHGKLAKRWPAEARKLSDSLARHDKLNAAVAITIEQESLDARWERPTIRSRSQAIVAKDRWVNLATSDSGQPMLTWSDKKERGVIDGALLLGRRRESTPHDIATPDIPMVGPAWRSIEAIYNNYTPTIEKLGEDRILLTLAQESNPKNEMRLTIDTKRNVLLRQEDVREGKTASLIEFSDFVEAGGCYWAQKVERRDAEGRVTLLATNSFKTLKAEALAKLFEDRKATYSDAQIIKDPLPPVKESKRAIAEGVAEFENYLTLAWHFSLTQQWERALENLTSAENVAGGKPGLRWVRYQLLSRSRQREELKQRLMQEATKLAANRPDESPYAGETALCQRIFTSASSALQTGEMIRLIDAMRPIYERQPSHRQVMKTWLQWKVGQVANMGDSDRTLALHKKLATDFPEDYNLQRQYANYLYSYGDYDAAAAWLNRVIVPERKWLPYEEGSLRDTYVQLLRNQGRYDDMLEYLSGWVKQQPVSQSPYAQYLSVLVRTDQEEKANEHVSRWMKLEMADEKTETAEYAKLQAAVNQALGQGYNLRTNRIEERWLEPLAELAWNLALHPTKHQTANTIVTHRYFRNSDECRDVRGKAAAHLVKQMEFLDYQQASRLINWISANDPRVEKATWLKIAAGLKLRWDKEKGDVLKSQWAILHTQILASHIGVDEQIAFIREKIDAGPKKYRTAYRNELFNALIARPWTAECEDEAFALLPRLSDSKEEAERSAAYVTGLIRLTNAMLSARNAALMLQIKDQEKLSDRELAEKKKENLKLARTEFAKRLQAEFSAARKTDVQRQWLKVEWIYVNVMLGDELNKMVAECWELLGNEPPGPLKADEDGLVEITPSMMLENSLRQRLLTTLANLSARRSAKPEDVERLLVYVDKALAAQPESLGWQSTKYRLLIALDRPQKLEKALREWIQVEKPLSGWRVALAKLLAEQGKIEPAITILEAVEKADELTPPDYRTLAGWYLVVDQKEKYRRAQVAQYMTMDEWQMRQWLQQQVYRWQQSDQPLPEELDEQVFIVLEAYFAKASQPQYCFNILESLYRESKEFRLLSGLADGMLGHTSGKVYPMLRSVSSVLSQVREEATVDELVERISELREKAKTPIDHRALDLLEVAIERRAAELINQPGPHGDKALAALKRAFKREWSTGEPRLMAELLSSMGRINYQPLADEQLRQLRELQSMAEPGTSDRLNIIYNLATTEWSYGNPEQAIDLLRSALEEYQEAHEGLVTGDARNPFSTLVSYYKQKKRHSTGEKLIQDQLALDHNQNMRDWFDSELYRLYYDALYADTQVSLGQHETLYENLEAQFRSVICDKELPSSARQYDRIRVLCDVYRVSKNKKYDGVRDDLRTFAFEQLPNHLNTMGDQYSSIVSQVGDTLHDVIDARSGLEFLVAQIEQEPRWLRLANRDGWSQQSYNLARWRSETKNLGELESRLLAIVLRELREDLRTQQSRNRNMYWKHHSHYWNAKEADFARVANDFFAKHKNSYADVMYVADYMHDGLHRYDRAIEMLFDAHRREILPVNGRARLVDYLRRRNRWGETIALLQPMVEEFPDNIHYRVQLMSAYFHTKQPDALLALLDKTDDYFHERSRWNENILSQLAASTRTNELYARSAEYYEELIALHQRTQPNRGIGNGTLSQYYRNLAEVYLQLGNTPKAVDAASAAIVSWGPTNDNRRDALNQLVSVLERSKDIESYISQLDKESAESGLGNPIVRKAIGQALIGNGKHEQAISQLKLAIELQPNDIETYRLLIQCLDKENDDQGVADQLLAAVELNRRELSLYRELGDRYRRLDKPQLAERAFTSIVEMQPNESESHTMLAEIRQRQDRWSDAIEHWRRVADLRALEPTGLIALAKAQLHEKRWDEARETIRRLRQRTWPSRFGSTDSDIRNLEYALERESNR